MNCRVARHQMALWIGSDLSQSGVFNVEEHLHDCPECRKYHAELQTSVDALASYSSATASDEQQKSLLPQLLDQLPQEVPPMGSESRWPSFFDGALRVAVIAAAVAVIGTWVPDWIGHRVTPVVVGPRIDSSALPPNFVRRYSDPTWQSLETLDPADISSEALRNVSY